MPKKVTEARIQRARSDVQKERKPQKLFDTESGLYLQARPGTTERPTVGLYWRLRLTKDGKEQHVALGHYPDVNRDEAANRARAVRLATKDGRDPAVVAAELRGDEVRRPEPAGDSFKSVAQRWLDRQDHRARSTRVRNARVIGYLVDELGAATRIGSIDAPALRAALLRIEPRGGETVRRALTLAGVIWRYAMGNGITDRNPVTGLKAEEIFAPVTEKHFAAVTDPDALTGLLRAIDNYSGQPVTRLALQVLVRVFTRPGELRLAAWREFTLDGATPQWVVPVERMKMRNREPSEHIVPLASQVVTLLRELQKHRVDELVFPSLREGRPISENTINMALRNMGYDTQAQHCAHGFRSTASTLLHQNGFEHDVIEAQLAHKRPGVSGVYNRAHLLDQRRALMQSWSDYLDLLTKL